MTHHPQPILLPTSTNLALAALHTYRNGPAPMAFHRPLDTLQAGSLLADIYQAQDGLVIAVRGTDSFYDWAYNLPVSKRCSDYLPGEIHTGFARATQHITVPLREWLALNVDLARLNVDQQPKKIWLAGHSLGGAVVTFLAPWLQQNGFDVMGIHTYGSPRVGDSVYRQSWDRLFAGVSHRYVNSVDGVPMLPPLMLGYRHVAGLNYYNRQGRPTKYGTLAAMVDKAIAAVRHIGTPGTAAIDRHAMARYAELLRASNDIAGENNGCRG